MIYAPDILHSRILIVDDQQVNVRLLERMLWGAGYDAISTTEDSRGVCQMHREHNYDLILLDLQMPGLDGFQVMEGLKKIETGNYLPVLVITAQPDQKLRALKAGARDFITKPFDLSEVLLRVHNMLEVRLLHKQLLTYNDVLEQRVLARTEDLQENYLETIHTMLRAAEHKDEDTGAHVKRISFYCRELASLLKLDAEFVNTIFLASSMHDIGKIGIPDSVLLKPGSLTPEEWTVMKGHTSMGAKILGSSKSPYLKMGAEIALNHHERWNGGGYPSGKRGDSIPISARLMQVCDVYDALRSRRPYKKALEHAEALAIMAHGDGRTEPEHFDPTILAAFQQNHLSFQHVYETYKA